MLARKVPPIVLQHDSMDCGAACLSMVLRYFGIRTSYSEIKKKLPISKFGVSLFHLLSTAKLYSLCPVALKITTQRVSEAVLHPCILHWDESHYVVLYKVKRNKFYIADPAVGYVQYNRKEFEAHWRNNEATGVAVYFEPNPEHGKVLYQSQIDTSLRYIKEVLKPHTFLLLQIFISVVFISILQVSFPYFSRLLFDEGITKNNLKFVFFILAVQFTLTLGRVGIEFIRSWIIFHISTRINFTLIKKFIEKLLQLPVSFYDTRTYGDIVQRIGDHKRVEQFLTVTTVNTAFSIISFFVFSTALIWYNWTIFIVALCFSAGQFYWTLSFLAKRRTNDYQRFNISSKTQNIYSELFNGIREIQLYNIAERILNRWKDNQFSAIKFNVRALTLAQRHQIGATLLGEIRNVTMISLSAYFVISGKYTLGTLIAVQYIATQLSTPLSQFISLANILQDTKISIERINEVHDIEENVPLSKAPLEAPLSDIALTDVCFRYDGAAKLALQHINLKIPAGGVTAIVGGSGSGKTSLLKLLLNIYEPTSGSITIGTQDSKAIDSKTWRSLCGSVLQDSFIFSDTIANNIAVGSRKVDPYRLDQSLRFCELVEFTEALPQGTDTKIGADGMGVSQGQRQRILLARCMYANPQYVFLDEATNSLDSVLEAKILTNIKDMYAAKTIVIIAHRLSTVRSADNIVVMGGGTIQEQGTHAALILQRGVYFNLVNEQLSLS